MRTPAGRTAWALQDFETALRLQRTLLRRRAAAFAAVAAACVAWATVTGGAAWLPVPLFAGAGVALFAQLRAPPGRDYADALRVLALADLRERFGTVWHMRHPRATEEIATLARLGLLAPERGWTIEDAFEASPTGTPVRLLSLRHADGRGLLAGYAKADSSPSWRVWPQPRPPLLPSWSLSKRDASQDIERVARAFEALR